MRELLYRGFDKLIDGWKLKKNGNRTYIVDSSTQSRDMEENVLVDGTYIAGYFEGRRVDIADILQMYKECGYHYNVDQEAFMEKYAYLEIHYNHPIWKEDIILRLNPIEAQKDITMDVVEEYNEFLQDDLLIIGDIEKENLTIFLSEKGLYYSGYDDCLKNEFYHKNLPGHVTPGTKYLPKYDEVGNVKQIKMYDDYGREIGWVDYTNHGYGNINSPDYHANTPLGDK